MVWRKKKEEPTEQKDKIEEYNKKIAELKERIDKAQDRAAQPIEETTEEQPTQASVGNFNPFEAEMLRRLDEIIKLLKQ